jgi:hypothetical protein
MSRGEKHQGRLRCREQVTWYRQGHSNVLLLVQYMLFTQLVLLPCLYVHGLAASEWQYL